MMDRRETEEKRGDDTVCGGKSAFMSNKMKNVNIYKYIVLICCAK